MKKPDVEKLTKMYGQNKDRKKAYRKGWETVGKVLAEKKEKKEKKAQVPRPNGYTLPTAKDLASKAAPRGRNRGRGR